MHSIQLNIACRVKVVRDKTKMLNPSAKSTMEMTNLNSKAHSYYKPLNYTLSLVEEKCL